MISPICILENLIDDLMSIIIQMAQNVVIKRKENQIEIGGRFGFADVALNNREIYDLIEGLKSERLSPANILKIQQLNRQFLLYRTLIIGTSVPIAWWMAGWLLVNPRKSWTRYRVMMTIPLALPIGALLRQVPMRRRILTDIVTQDGEDGPYIRKALRKWKPGLWTKISAQLYKLGYEFSEMNEFKNTLQFPTAGFDSTRK